MQRGDFSFALADGSSPRLRLPDDAHFVIRLGADGRRTLCFPPPLEHLTIEENETVDFFRWDEIRRACAQLGGKVEP